MVINPTSHDHSFALAENPGLDAFIGIDERRKNATIPSHIAETPIQTQHSRVIESDFKSPPQIIKDERTVKEDPGAAFQRIIDRLKAPISSGTAAFSDFLSRLNLLNSTLRNPFESMFRPPVNDVIRSAVDEIRATGAPGSRNVRIGKKKYNVSVDAYGNVTVKRRRGFWSKLGGFLKKIAPFALQALNFVPGLGTALSGIVGKITAFTSKLGGISGTIAKTAMNIAGLSSTGISTGGIVGGFLSKVGLGSLLESMKSPK